MWKRVGSQRCCAPGAKLLLFACTAGVVYQYKILRPQMPLHGSWGMLKANNIIALVHDPVQVMFECMCQQLASDGRVYQLLPSWR
jgi:hypothetical protein